MTSPRNGRTTENQDTGQQRKQTQKAPSEATGPVPGAETEAAPQVEGLGGDFSEATFQRHAALLGDPRLSHPANARRKAQMVRQLQRDYGNQYVQRVVEQIKRVQVPESKGFLLDSPALDKVDTGHAGRNLARLEQPGLSHPSPSELSILRQASVDATRMSITPPLAETLSEKEIYNQIIALRKHLRTLDDSDPIRTESQRNLNILTSELSNRPRYNLEFGSVKLESVTALEAARAVRKLHTRILVKATGDKAGHEHLKELRDDQFIVGFISEVVGGFQEMPPLDMWDVPFTLLNQAKSRLDALDIYGAVEKLQEAEEEYKKCHDKYYEYKEGTIAGAEYSVTGLKVTAAAGAVAAGVATGGAASGFTLVGQAAAGGLSAGAYSGMQGTAGQVGEMAAGIREEFDWKKIIDKAGTDAVTGFVGGIAGGLLQKGFLRLCPKYIRGISDEGLARINAILAEDGLTPVTRESLIPIWQKAGTSFLSSMATKPLTEATNITLESLPKGETPALEQVLDKIGAEFWAKQGTLEALAELAKSTLPGRGSYR